jgi:hypothetical protein
MVPKFFKYECIYYFLQVVEVQQKRKRKNIPHIKAHKAQTGGDQTNTAPQETLVHSFLSRIRPTTWQFRRRPTVAPPRVAIGPIRRPERRSE